MRSNNRLHSWSAVKGFSLVELMVSVVIGIIVINGVLQVVASSKKSYSDHQEVSFIQENARYALDMLSRDIRMAGYRGCASETGNVVNVIQAAADDSKKEDVSTTGVGFFMTSEPLEGFDDVTDYPGNFNSDRTAGDAIIIRRGDFENEYFVEKHISPSQFIELAENHTIENGLPVILANADCRNVGLFINTAATPTTVTKNIGHAASTGNCSDKLGGGFECDVDTDGDGVGEGNNGSNIAKSYTRGSRLMEYVAHAYYIGESSVLDNVPALKREVLMPGSSGLITRSEELAIGVEDVAFTYGIDTDDDSIADIYKGASDAEALANFDWGSVLTVRMTLTLRSESRVDAATNTDDGYLRQTISSTISLRNRG